MQLRGIIPPTVTPMYADEEIDRPRFRAVIDRMMSAGVHGIFILGTTGEFYALDRNEKQAIMAEAVAHVGKRLPVIAGTGAVTTREAIALTKLAGHEKCDAVTVITPYFIKPTQQELFEHFLRIAESTSLPVVLYQNPSHCNGVRLEVETVARLAEIPNIVGMKDSAGDLAVLAEYVRAVPPTFAVLQGRDTHIAPALEHGAKGAVPATSNIAPRLAVAIYEAHARGDVEGARAAQARFSPIREGLLGTAPGGIKAALRAVGFDCGPNRAPIGALTAEQEDRLRAVVAGAR